MHNRNGLGSLSNSLHTRMGKNIAINSSSVQHVANHISLVLSQFILGVLYIILPTNIGGKCNR